ncbi:MAG: alpha/beta fold hydrolase, partial [Gemmatimonadota bacterium]|nr:alpha/beta fold hydrolase [Gemmatimonadota bacterium]
AFITHNGVRLHYLDWGGTRPAVILLPGYALTAHAFDDVGRLLAGEFRIIVVTPRGFGESDAPDSGTYTIGTMVADLRALLDSLGIHRAALVGHSIAGSTISEFARAYPHRVTKLVFLDAFPYFAAAGGDSVEALSPVTQHAFTGEMTYPRLRQFLTLYRFGGWSTALEADLRANALGGELARRRALTDGYVRDQRAHPPDLGALTVPALQILAGATARLAAQGGIIRGHVVRADWPAGLPDAHLELRPSGARTRTDARGFFVFRGLPPGQVEVLCAWWVSVPRLLSFRWTRSRSWRWTYRSNPSLPPWTRSSRRPRGTHGASAR